MYCNQCGNQINSGDKFCRGCGKPVPGAQVSVPVQPIYPNQQVSVPVEPIYPNQQVNVPVEPIYPNQQVGNMNQNVASGVQRGTVPNDKRIVWESNMNGKQYKFDCECQKGNLYKLIINDTEPMLLHSNFINSMVIGFESHFIFDGIQMCLVVPTFYGKSAARKQSKNRIVLADVVVNGRCIRTGEEYIPTPKWVYIFIVLCALMAIGGGAIPIVMAIAGVTGCLTLANSKVNTVAKILGCIGITVLSWAICLFVIMAVLSL